MTSPWYLDHGCVEEGWMTNVSKRMRNHGFSGLTSPAVQPQGPTSSNPVPAFWRKCLMLPQSHPFNILDPRHLQGCSRGSLENLQAPGSCSSQRTVSCLWSDKGRPNRAFLRRWRPKVRRRDRILQPWPSGQGRKENFTNCLFQV